MTFTAQYPGLCDRCDGTVRPGDEAAYDRTEGNSRALVHAACPAPPEPRAVCPSCFIELPVSGVCEECT